MPPEDSKANVSPITAVASSQSGERLLALDGLRGIAASMVVIAHAVSALAKPVPAILALHHSPVALLSNGGGGVHIFFVLSGFCLARPATQALGWLQVTQFYARRALRIHPPYVIGLLISWVLSGWVYERGAPFHALSLSMIELRKVHISPFDLQHALLFPGPAQLQLPVGWTLHVEALFSILLPLLMLIAIRTHWLLLAMVSLPALMIKAETSFDFLRFFLDFSFGIAIYCERKTLSNLFERIPALARGMLLMLGIGLLSSPVYYMLDAGSPVRSLVLYCSGAAIIVTCAVHIPTLQRILSLSGLAWIGRISYSVYLIHAPIIILLTPFVDHRLNFLEGTFFVVICLVASYLIAPLVYYGVERPSMRSGYWASRKLATLGRGAVENRT